MKRQINIHQVEEHGKNSQDQLNEEEIGNLPEKEFRVMIRQMFQNLENKRGMAKQTRGMDQDDARNAYQRHRIIKE